MEWRTRCTVVFACACCVPALPAQGEAPPANGSATPTAEPAAEPADESLPGAVLAERCYQRLLQPATRPAAMHTLWDLQQDALPVLSRAVRSKDLAVVQAACAVLHDIGRVARPVRDILVRERRGAQGERRTALEWALCAIEARGFTLATWQGEVLFVDDDGEVVRSLDGFQSAWDVQTLPNARLLLTQVSQTGTRELDDQGKQLKAFGAGGQTLRARRLWNGNTMVVDSQKGVFEYDPTGKQVWKCATGTNCAVRLLNGHTLMVTSGGSRLREVDRDGKKLREVTIPDSTYGIRALPNGRALLATRSGQGVVIVDREGEVVRTFEKVENPSDAILLEDGSILICGGQKAVLFGPKGKERWSITRQWVAGACRGGIY